MKSLHCHIPRESLPREYGGTLGPFDNSKWKKEILNDHEYFKELEKFSV